MRIAFCGTQGSGKTSLAKEVSRILGIPFVHSFARDFLLREEVTLGQVRSDFWTLLGFQEFCFRKAESLEGSFVCDRSIYDMLAYSYLELGNYCSEPFFDRSVEYDFLFFCPFRKDLLVADGLREVNFVTARIVHFLILGILTDKKVEFEFVKGRTLRERVDEVLEKIKAGFSSFGVND